MGRRRGDCDPIRAVEKKTPPKRGFPISRPGAPAQEGAARERALKRGIQFGQDFEQVGDQSVIGDLEYRGFLVLVYGDDDL